MSNEMTDVPATKEPISLPEALAASLTPIPAEAGFSANLFLNNNSLGRVMFTFRGATSTDWGAVLEDMGRFLGYMKEKGWLPDGEVAPKSTGVSKAPAAPSAPKAKSSQAPADIDTSVNTMTISKVKVMPRDDGKVEIQLFQENHKWPDLKWYGTPEKAAAALSNTGYEWDASHFEKAAEYSMTFDVDWRNSATKTNSKGEPYKDVVNFRPGYEGA